MSHTFPSCNHTSQLPTEILREIFTCLIFQHVDNKFCKYEKAAHSTNKQHQCICWQLDLLSVSLVCKSWYRICLELVQSRLASSMNDYQYKNAPWLALLNYANFQRAYPFRSRMASLLKESKSANLIFHKQVKHLVIDFASFDTIRREKVSNNLVIKRKVHQSEALQNTIELFRLCDNIERLDFVFDAGFTSLTSPDSQGNRILYTSKVLSKILLEEGLASRIKQLVLVGYNPIQRCPCCAGKEWDLYLGPILKSLINLETLVLQNVLPSANVFEELVHLEKIVFYKSMVTIPAQRRGDANSNNSGLLTSVNQIPKRLWSQIKSVEIFEDIEDATTWKCKRYLDELVDHVGPQLENLVLQFGTKDEIERCVKDGFCDARRDKLYIQDAKSPLHQLKWKCKNSLKQILLINVPPV